MGASFPISTIISARRSSGKRKCCLKAFCTRTGPSWTFSTPTILSSNERLARHYGIPNVYGPDFRRVPVPSDARRGLLGQGSMLLVTSNANRTSPVQRGKWILENLLGSPPPLPPPNVPPLKESSEAGARHIGARAHGATSLQSGLRRMP